MATEYIKREDALNAIRKSPISNMGTRIFCIDAIADIPAADVVEQKHGKWMEIRKGVIPSGYCSECEIWNRVTAYCPNCGAQMEIGDSDV